jgi:hypothetical protein
MVDFVNCPVQTHMPWWCGGRGRKDPGQPNSHSYSLLSMWRELDDQLPYSIPPSFSLTYGLEQCDNNSPVRG